MCLLLVLLTFNWLVRIKFHTCNLNLLFTISIVIKHKKMNLKNALNFFPSLSLCVNQYLIPSDSFTVTLITFCIFLSLFFLFSIQICITVFSAVKKSPKQAQNSQQNQTHQIKSVLPWLPFYLMLGLTFHFFQCALSCVKE